MQPLTIFYPLRDYLDSLQSFDLFRTFLVLLYLPVFHFNIIHSFYFSCFTSRHSTLHYLTLHNVWSHLLKKSLMENFSFLQCNKRPFGNKCSSWNLSSNFMSVYRKRFHWKFFQRLISAHPKFPQDKKGRF